MMEEIHSVFGVGAGAVTKFQKEDEKGNPVIVRFYEKKYPYEYLDESPEEHKARLEKAFAAFLRTNSYFFIVINKNNELVGLLTVEMLIGYLLGKAPTDKFEADSDRLSVAVR